MFQGCFKDVSRMFQGCFKEFSRKLLLHEILESVTRKIEECFEDVLRIFHRSLKGTSRKVVQSSFQGLQERFKEISKELKGCFKCFDDVSLQFQGKFKYISYLFQGCLNNFYGHFLDV